MRDERSVLILVLERDPYIQALESALLHDWGYRAEFAPDGEAAVEMVKRTHPRLVVADILVPKLNGLQVCRIIKESPETRDTKVLIFSDLLAERRAREAGADAFLLKPLDEDVFVATVEQLLEASRPAAQAATPTRRG